MRVLTLVIAAALAPSCGEESPKRPCDAPYSCPDPGWVDCMPPWPNDNNECLGECHQWIVDNCPDVQFAW